MNSNSIPKITQSPKITPVDPPGHYTIKEGEDEHEQILNFILRDPTPFRQLTFTKEDSERVQKKMKESFDNGRFKLI